MPPTSTRPDARHGLRVTAPHGYYISDETCRRGEIRVHPDWSTLSEPMDIARARPLLTLMGINLDDPRQNGRAA